LRLHLRLPKITFIQPEGSHHALISNISHPSETAAYAEEGTNEETAGGPGSGRLRGPRHVVPLVRSSVTPHR